MNIKSNSNRQGNIDGARGIAAVGVVLYHYTVNYSKFFELDYSLPFVNRYGNIGVTFFFILSAYFLMRKMLNDNIKPSRYVYQRIVRLWPSYAIAVLVTGSFLLLTNSSLKSSVTGILLNLTMLNKLIGVPYVDGVYHTLTNELILLAVSTSILVTKLYKNPKLTILAWGGVTVIGRIILGMLGKDSDLMLTLWFGSKYSFAFLTGYIFAYRKQEKKPWQIFGLLCIAIYTYITMGMMYFAYIVISGIIVWVLLQDAFHFLGNKLFLFFGGISYQLFLIHEYIGFEIIHRLDIMGWKNELNIILPFVVVVIISVLIKMAADKLVSLFFKPIEGKIWR